MKVFNINFIYLVHIVEIKVRIFNNKFNYMYEHKNILLIIIKYSY